MSIERFLKRKADKDPAVYWAPSGTLRGDGTLEYAAPVEIGCIWHEVLKNIINDQDKEVVSKAVIHVVTDLAEHGVLYHGALTDLSIAEKADPREVDAAFEIIKFYKTPSLSLPSKYDRRALI